MEFLDIAWKVAVIVIALFVIPSGLVGLGLLLNKKKVAAFVEKQKAKKALIDSKLAEIANLKKDKQAIMKNATNAVDDIAKFEYFNQATEIDSTIKNLNAEIANLENEKK